MLAKTNKMPWGATSAGAGAVTLAGHHFGVCVCQFELHVVAKFSSTRAAVDTSVGMFLNQESGAAAQDPPSMHADSGAKWP